MQLQGQGCRLETLRCESKLPREPHQPMECLTRYQPNSNSTHPQTLLKCFYCHSKHFPHSQVCNPDGEQYLLLCFISLPIIYLTIINRSNHNNNIMTKSMNVILNDTALQLVVLLALFPYCLITHRPYSFWVWLKLNMKESTEAAMTPFAMNWACTFEGDKKCGLCMNDMISKHRLLLCLESVREHRGWTPG